MDVPANNNLPSGAIMYLIHHVFLPPKLPQEDDFDTKYEAILVDITIDSLSKFKIHLENDQKLIIDSVISMITNLKTVHHSGTVGENELRNALKDLFKRGGTVPLHLRAQNAGLLFSELDNSIRVEAFELSPLNEAVITTKGRLRRSFPGRALHLNHESFEQPKFQATIAQTLAKMSHQPAVGTQPRARKAEQMHDEERDTTHPKIVTELFLGFLRPFAKPVDVPLLWKNTREEVLWLDSVRPWRRSPLWLLIRVAMQLELSRANVASHLSGDIYKPFMVFLMSHILELSHQYCVPSDLTYAMNAKLARRLLKLKLSFDAPGFKIVRRNMQNACNILQDKWSSIMKHAKPPCNLSRLGTLDFRSDTFIPLPALNQYLEKMDKRKEKTTAWTFEPGSSLIKYPAEDLPTFFGSSNSDLLPYELKALEAWVDCNLSLWLKTNQGDRSTCGKLAGLIRSYYDVAHGFYSDNPEATSLMLLTILEIWIACDESATHNCELLKDYDPGIPRELFTSLALPFKSQMRRLLRVEDYLLHRSRVKFHAPHIFSEFGKQDSFSVRYFEKSLEHQELLKRIEQDATETRRRKREELRQKKKQYDSLMKLHDSIECDTREVIIDRYNDFREQRHDDIGCKKCSYKSQADDLAIRVHEWPLPSSPMGAQSTVFEMRIPSWFGHWRDTTMFLLIDVLKVEYLSMEQPRLTYLLENYNGLSSFFVQFDFTQRIGLLSQNKPHELTHRRDRCVVNVTEDDICVNNGLRYKYHDRRLGCFVSGFRVTDKIPKLCTFTLPAHCASLQQFLLRPASMPSGPPPNTVMATQFDCPDSMSLDEYRALSLVPLGYRIQWQNILLQLSMPTVNFKKVETGLTVLQAIYQAGPPKGDHVLREGHAIVEDENFCTALLNVLEQALERIKENWESSQTLSTLVSLATRILSLTTAGEIEQKCLAYLCVVRDVAFKWVNCLRDKVHESMDDDQRADLRLKAVEVALICVDSFNLEGAFLDHTLSTQKHASVLLQCSIIIQEGGSVTSSSSDALAVMLYLRWKCLSYRSCSILRREFLQGRGESLDLAIKKSWSAYQAGDRWQTVSEDLDHWLVNRTASNGGIGSLTVHFNLLTGELLVNGLPLARLPLRYERHPMYRTLFGNTAMEVMPTAVPGMQFSGKKEYSGYTLHLSIDPAPDGSSFSLQNDFLVQAFKDGQNYELIPARLILEEFPSDFVDNFVHWYNVNDDCLEFRPLEDPWAESLDNWKLVRINCNTGWRLMKNKLSLIGVKSETGKLLSKILAPLEDRLQIHNFFHHSSSSLEIELPRLQLGFNIQSQTSDIQSRQFREMCIDKDQSLGTLVGLCSKLVLKNEKNGNRLVIIPEGGVTYESDADHVRVNIRKDLASKAHAYHVDTQLGRLLDNGSLQSKLFLCYLHSLTSFCLPDPLIHRTGTEQALSILDSAAVRSFDRLTQDNIEILGHIARLTPGRTYYPANERVMQTVSWSQGIDFMAQHGGFYKRVSSILDQSDAYNVFHPEFPVERLKLDHVEEHLLERDCIRSSTFRVSGFGAEDHTVNFDSTYSPRDRDQNSASGFKAFVMSNIVHHERRFLHYQVQEDLKEHFWNVFSQTSDIHGPSQLLPFSEIEYDARLLLGKGLSNLVSKHWSALHHTLSGSHPQFNKFCFMIWLSTLAFADRADMQILQTLASFFVAPDMAQISAPKIDNFRLHRGAKPDQYELSNDFRPALLPLARCPEATLTSYSWETNQNFRRRQQDTFRSKQNDALDRLVKAMESQWPCEALVTPSYSCPYLDFERAIDIAKPKFKTWFDNHRYARYLEEISTALKRQSISPLKHPSYPISNKALDVPRRQGRGFVSMDDILTFPAPHVLPCDTRCINDLISSCRDAKKPVPRLTTLIETLGSQTRSSYEESYVRDLKRSLSSLQDLGIQHKLQISENSINKDLVDHLSRTKECVHLINESISSALVSPQESERSAAIAADVKQWPRVSPIFLLQQLSHRRSQKLSHVWKNCIVQYGIALTELHRAERLLNLTSNHVELIRELQNSGHTNWDPFQYPESLLLEVENGMMIREVQEQLAEKMTNPPSSANSVMQLNMGEGKSSVIVPVVAATLADGSRLVRVIVAKPQSKQMLEMLVSKLGGLLDRRVYHMPFSRALKLRETEALAIGNMYRGCMENGGVLLVQPEHILSFKLMGLECFISNKEIVGQYLLNTQDFFDTSSRDIVDESDENFNVKFELIYTMGMQQPIEFSPDRWVCIQHVLRLVMSLAPSVKQRFPKSIDVNERQPGSFPRTRILRSDAEQDILYRIAEHICETGIIGFPIARQPERVRQAVFKYLTKLNLSSEEIAQVENGGSGGFWTDSTSATLLLLRGLIAGGVLSFAFGEKRWRVNYGLDIFRRPRTQLAVPYRAKDVATARSEFSHPDVVIVLTSLTYYYGGLRDDELFLALNHLLTSDQADIEYDVWVNDAPDLPLAFRNLLGINLKDKLHCIDQVFPPLRYAKGAIDYFLAHIVFPKEMKEFPYKLSASGWDIGQIKTHPTTGFSGTNDSRKVLPLSIEHLNLPEQEHTNALVLEYLLQPENSVAVMQPCRNAHTSDAQALLFMVMEMKPTIQVILDVGAQILELSNVDVAKEWLKLAPNDTKAVVFFNNTDELYVLDRKDNIEALQTSSFATQLDVCLVYLDESHTRGTDLKLPTLSRAAVTLGPNLTKDRLVQACMRMRKLGKGQSVVFCVPEEIKTKILTRASKPSSASIEVSDVLSWAISETFIDTRRNMPLWAEQGRRFEHQSSIWAECRTPDGILMSKSQAEKFLEDESRSLDDRYRPRSSTDISTIAQSSDNHNLNLITDRCRELNHLEFNSATLQEEQERELSPEIEQERQVQKSAPAKPRDHHLHLDLVKFVSTGVLVTGSKAYVPAFEALRTTSVAAHLDVSHFPKGLLVTTDFANTIQVSDTRSYVSDSYQWPVQWILTSTEVASSNAVKHMLIISSFEAQEISSIIKVSKTTTLHLYAPRPNLGFRPLDHLDLFTYPSRHESLAIPRNLTVLLNLFAGQLYLDSFEEYIEVCELLGLAWEKSEEGSVVAADGFILKDKKTGAPTSTFKDSPVKFLKVFLTKIRRNCETIDKTHMGKLLDGTLLTRADFEELENDGA
ncbi:hypothetical protein EG329_006578 [Mollisiaceae sp. DMI_Dod_QoI]|nr:hypothetical protein EG329_006578 [Helotiales sp. DMI_Dod_QoI]